MVVPDSSDGNWAECSAPPSGSDPDSNAGNDSDIRIGHALDVRVAGAEHGQLISGNPACRNSGLGNHKAEHHLVVVTLIAQQLQIHGLPLKNPVETFGQRLLVALQQPVEELFLRVQLLHRA